MKSVGPTMQATARRAGGRVFMGLRRRAVMALAASVALLVPLGFVPVASAAPRTTSWAKSRRVEAARAVSTYKAMQKYLYIPNYKLYQSGDSSSLFSYLWDFTNAFAATDYVAGIPGHKSQYRPDLRARDQGIAAYYDPHETDPAGQAQPPAYESAVKAPLGSGGSTYYDDNAWVALDYLNEYNVTAAPKDLAQAEGIFKFVVSGWDTTTSDTCPGGTYWQDVAAAPRNTISNAPNAEVGLLIYKRTKNPYYLQWATKMYDWVRSCMLTSNGMYYDHINPDGSINTALWSYNQGTMIGAGTLLSQITGTKIYLQQAEQTASASITYYSTGTNLYQQPDVFDAIFFRNLFYLARVDHNPSYRALAVSYADQAWTKDRQVTGLFTDPDGTGGESLVNQTAPMIEIYALLGGSAPFG